MIFAKTRDFVKQAYLPTSFLLHNSLPMPATSPQRNALLVGDFSGEEYAGIIEQVGQDLCCERVADISLAIECLQQRDLPVDLILIAQQRPNMFPQALVLALAQLAPLATLITVLGTWCEGETRSGRPLPGVTRIFWHQWSTRWEAERIHFLGGFPSRFFLPETASAEDHLLFPFATEPLTRRALLLVNSDDSAMREFLTIACHDAGHAVVPIDAARPVDVQGADAILWDSKRDDLGALATIRHRWPNLPILATLNFLRYDETVAAQQLGVTALIAKPFLLNDLKTELQCLLRQARPLAEPSLLVA